MPAPAGAATRARRTSAPGAAWCAEPSARAAPGGRLVVRNTFYHYLEDGEEDGQDGLQQLLRPSSSAAALLDGPPRVAGASQEDQPPSPAATERRTTVHLRNVPYLLTRDMLVEVLESHGFRGQFDLVYLPRDFDRDQTLGYAFVNASEPEVAIRLFRVFEGFQAWPLKSLKTCSVCWSHQQGLERNVGVYRNMTVMHEAVPEAWKPVLYSQGKPVPFPAPTRRIKPIWKQHRSATYARQRLRELRADVRMDGHGAGKPISVK